MTNFPGIHLSLEYAKSGTKVKDLTRAMMAMAILANDQNKTHNFVHKSPEWHKKNAEHLHSQQKTEEIALVNR
jgi:hypothetical protein